MFSLLDNKFVNRLIHIAKLYCIFATMEDVFIPRTNFFVARVTYMSHYTALTKPVPDCRGNSSFSDPQLHVHLSLYLSLLWTWVANGLHKEKRHQLGIIIIIAGRLNLITGRISTSILQTIIYCPSLLLILCNFSSQVHVFDFIIFRHLHKYWDTFLWNKN